MPALALSCEPDNHRTSCLNPSLPFAGAWAWLRGQLRVRSAMARPARAREWCDGDLPRVRGRYVRACRPGRGSLSRPRCRTM